MGGRLLVTEAVARNLYKLMAYKDEYEVARLSIDPAVRRRVEEQFGAGSSFSYRLHPPVLRGLDNVERYRQRTEELLGLLTAQAPAGVTV